jgi:hypothetical protein
LKGEIRKLMRGGESVKEDMMGKSLMGRTFFWREEEAF